jgi:glutathione-regulated potassium-efflux system ancillary protein KefC
VVAQPVVPNFGAGQSPGSDDRRRIVGGTGRSFVDGIGRIIHGNGRVCCRGFVIGILSFRHQLEADIEPFRGLLLGLFFLGVGMALNLDVVAKNWKLIASSVVALMVVKAVCIYVVARLAKSSNADAMDRAVLMAQGGEFAFVLFTEALKLNVINAEVNANMTAIVVLSMAITPLTVQLYKRFARAPAVSMDGIEAAHDLRGNVLIIGFGRVGQIASQAPLAQGAKLSIIDNDPDVIRAVAPYGFKVYYGDGARSDILHAAGAQHARAIIVCVNDKKAATRIVESAKAYCPNIKLLVRAFDREHALELVKHDADFVVRETFESALLLGRQAALAMGASEIEADALVEQVRCRDAERFALETSGGLFAGRALVLGNIERIDPPRHEED